MKPLLSEDLISTKNSFKFLFRTTKMICLQLKLHNDLGMQKECNPMGFSVKPNSNKAAFGLIFNLEGGGAP